MFPLVSVLLTGSHVVCLFDHPIVIRYEICRYNGKSKIFLDF